MSSSIMTRVEVVLRDFDGSQTIIATGLPLPNVIHSGQRDSDLTVHKTYLRIDETDENGRAVYVEQR